MPRRPRLFLPGLASHAIVRGNDRQDIFRSDGDRIFFLQCLREASLANNLAIHAYVLMSNHVHLLATSEAQDGLATAIQDTGRRYVRYFNHRHDRTGTLWEGRFRSTVVDSERYYFACHRYIEMNPVRAALVGDAIDYLWSSHRFYALGQPDDLVTPHSVMSAHVAVNGKPSGSYRGLFVEPIPEAIVEQIREYSNHGWALGSEGFCRQVEVAAGIRAIPIGKGWIRGRRRKSTPSKENGVV